MKRDYDFTNEQIENRVLADCNRERLKEHRQCNYFDLCFDCKVYVKRSEKRLCKFLDNCEKEKKHD